MSAPYAPPRIEASHSVQDLLADAASCQLYTSDAALKEDLRPVGDPVGQLGEIGRR